MTIVDVRTPAEFSGGHVIGSINIPLQQIPDRLQDFKKFKQPIQLCCASGNRSGQATAYLKAHGIQCSNAGSWMDVKVKKQTV
jgi:phage shock protein E